MVKAVVFTVNLQLEIMLKSSELAEKCIMEQLSKAVLTSKDGSVVVNL